MADEAVLEAVEVDPKKLKNLMDFKQ